MRRKDSAHTNVYIYQHARARSSSYRTIHIRIEKNIWIEAYFREKELQIKTQTRPQTEKYSLAYWFAALTTMMWVQVYHLLENNFENVISTPTIYAYDNGGVGFERMADEKTSTLHSSA